MTAIAALLRKLGEVEKATLVKELPGDPRDYRFEIKYDGYRILALKSGKDARLFSRNGKDWTDQFPSVAAAVAALPVEELVLDGEVCALDDKGRPSFNLLQNRAGTVKLTYAVFDLLWLGGEDLRGEPLEARREKLEGALERAKPPLSLASAVEVTDLASVMRTVCGQGLEGLIAKRKGSRYVTGRSRDWLKLKCTHRQEFALMGYLPFVDTTNRVGSLLLAVRGADGQFHYAGKVGTGFDAAARKEIAELLDRHRATTPTAVGMPRIKAAHFAEPALVGEVEFTEWTPDGKIRHPAFVGLRKDKRPEECIREESDEWQASAPQEKRAAPRKRKLPSPTPKKSSSRATASSNAKSSNTTGRSRKSSSRT
jgi:bifunctional non-homologous end joining protein LigD